MAQTNSTTTTTVPPTIEELIANVAKAVALVGTSTISAKNVSPTTRSPIGVEGTQILDPLTGKVTGYYGYMAQLPSGSPYVPAKVGVAPQYFNGDEDMLNGFAKENIAAYQYALKTTGLMSGKYTPGLVNEATRTGFKKLLGIANREGVDYQKALGIVGQAQAQAGVVGGKSGGAVKQLPKYTLTNEKDLRAVFKKTAEDLLGRNLGEGDLNRLVESFHQNETIYQKSVYEGKGRTVTEAPTAQTFAETKISKKFGQEADARKLGDIFGEIDRALRGNQ